MKFSLGIFASSCCAGFFALAALNSPWMKTPYPDEWKPVGAVFVGIMAFLIGGVAQGLADAVAALFRDEDDYSE